MQTASLNKKITIHDVAKAAEVSKSTVSLVLQQSDKVSEARKARVLKAIDELGYVYNRDAAALRGKKAGLVAMVVQHLDDPITLELVNKLQDELQAEGLTLLFCCADSTEKQRLLMTQLREYNLSALIIIPHPELSREWLDQLVNFGISIITVMREVPYSKASSVVPDYSKSTHLSVEYFLKLGYQQFILVCKTQNDSNTQERLRGLHSPINQADGQQHTVTIVSESDYSSFETLFAGLQHLLADNTVVICESEATSEMLQRQLSLLENPDSQIVTFNTTARTSSIPAIVFDTDEFSKRICQTLKDLLTGHAATTRTVVDVQLYI